MKIIIPLDENKKDVCVSFGRTPLFLLHDTETKETEYLVNPAAEAEGGAGILAAQFVVDSKAQILITVRCGENAAEVLKEAQMKIYKSSTVDAQENIALYEEGKLEELTRFHAGFHGGH